MLMPDYKNGKMYRIWENTYAECYIGSTTETLSSRMTRHRNTYTQWKEGLRRCCTVFSIFDKYGIENCKIELIECYPCDRKQN